MKRINHKTFQSHHLFFYYHYHHYWFPKPFTFHKSSHHWGPSCGVEDTFLSTNIKNVFITFSVILYVILTHSLLVQQSIPLFPSMYHHWCHLEQVISVSFHWQIIFLYTQFQIRLMTICIG